MSEDWKAQITRRPLLAALGALTGAVAVGGAAYEGVRYWSRGGSGDLLASLGSREQVILVGNAVLTDLPEFRAGVTAKSLSHITGGKPLADVLAAEAAQGRIVEAKGWVLPETLARLCAGAARDTDGRSIKSHA